MNNQAVEAMAKQMLKDMRGFLEQATSIVQAADACAAGGNVVSATRIVMDFEDPASRALEMYKAMLLLKREYHDDEFE